MRLYELARELNHPQATFLGSTPYGRFLNSGFSILTAEVEAAFRETFKPNEEASRILDRKKAPKPKKPKKKTPPKPKPGKEIEPDLAGDAGVAVAMDEDESATEVGGLPDQTPEDQAAPEQAAATTAAAATPVVEGGTPAAPASTSQPAAKTAAELKRESMRLGVVGKNTGLAPFVQTMPLVDESAAKTAGGHPSRRRVKRSLEERMDNLPAWEQKVTISDFQQVLNAKHAQETRVSRMMRMKLVFGHEIPKKERAKTSDRQKTESESAIIVPINIRDLSERIGVKAPEVIKFLMTKGSFLTILDMVDKTQAEAIAQNFQKTVVFAEAQAEQDKIQEIKAAAAEQDAALEPRPPVVTVMGHVDHGKTSLLDTIRNSQVAAGEAGGITQHIGGYQVVKNGHAISFLDTPGHAAFTAMRARGAKVTDLVVLVVAANDGVMPQTEEAVSHAKAAGVPIIVAVNKMDLPGAKMDKVKEKLAGLGLIPEEWSGHTPYVPVSALTGQGVDQLLEMILLQAEMLELKADHSCLAEGVVVESHQEQGRGVVVSVLVKNGTLHKGDSVLSGTGCGSARQLLDEDGKEMKEAGPSRIVKVTGLSECPSPGESFHAMPNIRAARDMAEERRSASRAKAIVERQPMSVEELMSRVEGAKASVLNLIVKADVQGSLEALQKALEESGNDEAKVKILLKGVGAVTESDVLLAGTSGAKILCFGVSADSKARKLAVEEGVDIRMYRIIYEMLDDVRKMLEGMLSPESREEVAGEIEVRVVFRITGAGVIAGSYVTRGYVERNQPCRLVRDGKVVYKGKIQTLRRFKEDVRRVEQKYECGIRLENFEDIRVGDTIEPYTVQEIQRTLEAR